ncbi:MAG: hypothetical protein H7A21_03145 [Spirochaetales bacterium]|nr:hypothetical protein [Spirochaetales bacterium]
MPVRQPSPVRLLALSALLFAACSPASPDRARPEAIGGVIDLSDWDFQKDGPVSLRGEWDFYWEQLREPGASAASSTTASHMYVPGGWNEYKPEGRQSEIGPYGFGTYELRLILPESAAELALTVPNQNTAHRTYLNGTLLSSDGVVSEDAALSVSGNRATFRPIPPGPTAVAHLLVQVSNYQHRTGGLLNAPAIGTVSSLSADSRRALFRDAFLLGCMILAGSYHSLLYLFRRKELAAFWFGLVCLSIALRILTTGTRLLGEALPDLQWSIMLRVEYISLYVLVPLLAGFLRDLFPDQFSRIVARTIVASVSILVVSVLVLPTTMFTRTLPAFQLLAVMSALYGLAVLAQSAWLGSGSTWFMLVGWIVLLGSMINDMLYVQVRIGTGFIGPLGLFVFALTHSAALSRRIARAFNRSEELSETLESRVVERTNQLSVAHDEAQAARLSAERARQEAEVLAQLARRANEARDPDGLVEQVGRILQSRYGAENIGLYVVSRESQRLLLRTGLLGEEMATPGRFSSIATDIPLVPASGSLYRTYRRARSLFARIDERWMRKFPVDAALVREWKFEWFVHLPLLVEDEVIGILTVVGRGAQNPFSREGKDFVERMAQQVSGAVRTMELLQETQAARGEAEEARAAADRILQNVLPVQIAEALKNEGQVEPLFYDSATVLFTDFVGFTATSETMLPDELVRELDICFGQFDAICRRHQLEKLKTIGDSYMCAGGLPEINLTHPIDACMAALGFLDFMETMHRQKGAAGEKYWEIRIGLHTGPVTAGVIGRDKFAYDIWGDTVNTASRLESSGSPGKVNISGDTYRLVGDFFECEHRGKVAVKGKKPIDMYFLFRIKPELSADAAGLQPNQRFEELREGFGIL